jgi:hypothetical protein
MNRTVKIVPILCLCAGALAATSAGAQSFGAAKQKVTLHRKLPALIHLPGGSVKIVVPGQDSAGDVAYDLQALLETEILKDDPDLRVEPNNPDTILTCSITGFYHPGATQTSREGVGVGGLKSQNFTRVAGTLSVSFQVKNAAGQLLISDNVESKYDQEFDSMGNSTSQGIGGSITGTFKRLKGGSSEEMNPPTDAELRSKLLLDVVQQIAEHIVNTDEAIDVFLAKEKGPIEEGDKQAEGELWERALETFETAQASSKPDEDAYRLYDIGVAYEALAYQADDDKTAMKYFDQAAINYGKAIDAKPAEKYFVDPQKRIETAIAHYKVLEEEKKPKPAPVVESASAAPADSGSAAPVGPTATRGLSNNLVISMVKAGMDDDTVVRAIGAAKAVSFDLTPLGEQQLKGNGVSARVMAAMKAQAATNSQAAAPKGLTNNQVIAMIKSGMDDDTVVTAIRSAKLVNFDLTPTGQQQLTGGGVSSLVLTAMKTRAARKPPASGTSRPVASTATKKTTATQ